MNFEVILFDKNGCHSVFTHSFHYTLKYQLSQVETAFC